MSLSAWDPFLARHGQTCSVQYHSGGLATYCGQHGVAWAAVAATMLAVSLFMVSLALVSLGHGTFLLMVMLAMAFCGFTFAKGEAGETQHQDSKTPSM